MQSHLRWPQQGNFICPNRQTELQQGHKLHLRLKTQDAFSSVNLAASCLTPELLYYLEFNDRPHALEEDFS